MGQIGALAQGIAPALGSVTSTIGALDQTFQTIRNFSSNPEEERRDALRAQQDLALQQLKAQQGLQQTQAANEAALERERLALQTQSAEESRQAALRRAVARQRANFGASGINTGGGSAQAVLLGLFEDSEEELQNRQRLDSLRSAAIGQSLSSLSQRNLLEQTQLAQRQQLQRAISDF